MPALPASASSRASVGRGHARDPRAASCRTWRRRRCRWPMAPRRDAGPPRVRRDARRWDTGIGARSTRSTSYDAAAGRRCRRSRAARRGTAADRSRTARRPSAAARSRGASPRRSCRTRRRRRNSRATRPCMHRDRAVASKLDVVGGRAARARCRRSARAIARCSRRCASSALSARAIARARSSPFGSSGAAVEPAWNALARMRDVAARLRDHRVEARAPRAASVRALGARAHASAARARSPAMRARRARSAGRRARRRASGRDPDRASGSAAMSAGGAARSPSPRSSCRRSNARMRPPARRIGDPQLAATWDRGSRCGSRGRRRSRRDDRADAGCRRRRADRAGPRPSPATSGRGALHEPDGALDPATVGSMRRGAIVLRIATTARSWSARRRTPAASELRSTIALLGVRSTSTHLPARAVDEHDHRGAERRRLLDQLDRLVERLGLLEHACARGARPVARRGSAGRRRCAPD